MCRVSDIQSLWKSRSTSKRIGTHRLRNPALTYCCTSGGGELYHWVHCPSLCSEVLEVDYLILTVYILCLCQFIQRG